MKTADGNAHEVRRSLTDKTVFGKILADFKKQVDFESIMVADRALYSQGNLSLIKDLKWITRVPLSVKAAQNLVTKITDKELIKSQENPGYANQLGKLTDRPTLRWIFQCFPGIHVVVINGVKQILNLTNERSLTLSFFPERCQQYYFSSA